MRSLPRWAGAFALIALLGACDDQSNLVEYRVTIENISPDMLIDTDRADGTAPLSAGVFAVYADEDPVFLPGQMATLGLELLAEDGIPGPALLPEGVERDTVLQELERQSRVFESGTFSSPGGPDSGPALFAGESTSFTIIAGEGDELQIATMFVQSNDWFVAFDDGGLDLFNILGEPISGDVTENLRIYDAGTEVDTAPGTGDAQKPAQDPNAIDIGDSETVRVELATERHPDFVIPEPSEFMRVTVQVLDEDLDDDDE